jgi:hypothetical protein
MVTGVSVERSTLKMITTYKAEHRNGEQHNPHFYHRKKKLQISVHTDVLLNALFWQ